MYKEEGNSALIHCALLCVSLHSQLWGHLHRISHQALMAAQKEVVTLRQETFWLDEPLTSRPALHVAWMDLSITASSAICRSEQRLHKVENVSSFRCKERSMVADTFWVSHKVSHTDLLSPPACCISQHPATPSSQNSNQWEGKRDGLFVLFYAIIHLQSPLFHHFIVHLSVCFTALFPWAWAPNPGTVFLPQAPGVDTQVDHTLATHTDALHVFSTLLTLLFLLCITLMF